MKEKLKLLFLTTFSVSATANSGYAILSVLKNRFVDRYKWFSEEQMNDFIALAQSTPGPVAVSISFIIGYQSAGIPGAMAAVTGCILPPILVMMAVTYFYRAVAANPYVRIFMQGMQAGVCAMLADVILSLFSNLLKKDVIMHVLLTVLCFLAVRYTDLSVFVLLLICIAVSVVKTFIAERKVAEK
ncbi:MAG: chromate transporter [Erysipelotrichaceae bacterium]|nr:chromate transporter [Erysipelotrichaceae bacterium]MBQ1533449.1 chromate transporter [Erysipelotrichaceae bacterium]